MGGEPALVNFVKSIQLFVTSKLVSCAYIKFCTNVPNINIPAPGGTVENGVQVSIQQHVVGFNDASL